MKKLNWREKYRLALQETLTIKEIMSLRDVGQPKATLIRNDAVKYCIDNNLDITSKGVDTSAVLEITGKNLEYYYNKMIGEQRCLTCLEV